MDDSGGSKNDAEDACYKEKLKEKDVEILLLRKKLKETDRFTAEDLILIMTLTQNLEKQLRENEYLWNHIDRMKRRLDSALKHNH
jgi:hypothetical protein